MSNTDGGPKAFLVIVSFLVGFIVFLYQTVESVPPPAHRPYDERSAQFLTSKVPVAAILAMVVMLSYPLIGAGVVAVSKALRQWAHEGKINEWDKGEQIVFAALWPLTALVSIILYPTLGLINRLF